MQPHPTLRVQNEQRRGALHVPGLHGERNRIAARVGPVDPHGEGDAVFVQEGPQGDFLHGGVMLEHRVQADHLHAAGRERLVDGLGLRDPMGNAAGTQHLEGMDDHHGAAQIGQGQRGFDIQPAFDVPVAGRLARDHHRVLRVRYSPS